MDCTYRTNKFRMPLFVVTGVTPLSTTFFVGFAFLSQERKTDYEWALVALKGLYDARGLGAPATLVTDRDPRLMGAIRAVFPGARHLLCLWHVAKNVVARCKRFFQADKAWTDRALHFGISTTSRVGGAHSALKGYL